MDASVELLSTVILALGLTFAVYSALLNLSFVVLTVLALPDLTGYRRRLDYAGYDEWFLDPNTRGVSVLMPAYNESPTIVQSVGVLSLLNGKDASFPRHQKTSSPSPAPTASSATVGFPFGFRSASSVCTIKNFRPSRVSFLIVETTVPITRASCNYAFSSAT